MTYCIYLRKSRTDIEAELRGEGETLVRHERALLELSEKYKLSITKIYKEIVSGETISSRPVMQQLLSEVEEGTWNGVLVMEVERLARGDTIDQGIVAQTFKYSNCKIITPMKTYDPNNEFDEEYFEFGLFMSRREYKTINRRLQRGRIESVKEGKYLGSQPPYGYTRKKLAKEKGYTLEINPDQAEIVKLIFELYTKGEYQCNISYKRLGTASIAGKLNELGIPPMRGTTWVASSLLDILKNPVYVGKIRWNSRPVRKKIIDGEMKKERPRANPKDCILVDGLHEAIVDNDTWELAQHYLANNSTPPIANHKKVKNPLSSLIICGICGRRMVRRPSGKRQPDTLMCPVTACKNVSSQLHLVEKHLLLSLEKWLDNYRIDWSLKGTEKKNTLNLQLDIKKKTIKKLDEQIKTLEMQMKNIHNLLEQGVYSPKMFLQRSKTITDELSIVENHKATLITNLQQIINKNDSKINIIPKVEKILELYNATNDLRKKNYLLKEVLEKVVYTKEIGGRWNKKTDAFQIALYPKLPQL